MGRVKGQVEAQFNWIFVLIAGAVILMVAFAFITKQRSAKKLENADKMLKIIDEITTGAGLSEGTAEILDLPNMEVGLKCTEECTCTVDVAPAPSSEFRSKIIFGPKKLNRRIMLWAQAWNKPFRVSNFVYVTSPTTKYYIVRNPSSVVGQYIEQRLPEFSEEFEITYVDSKAQMQAIQHPGTDHVRIVYVDEDTNCKETHPSFYREDYSCLVLNQAQSNIFYNKKSARSMEFDYYDTPAIGEAALFAAIFAEEYQLYKCNMHRAFDKLTHVAAVLDARTERLEAERLESPAVCAQYAEYSYDSTESAVNALGEIVDASKKLAYDLNGVDIGVLESSSNILQRQNRLADSEGCPPMY